MGCILLVAIVLLLIFNNNLIFRSNFIFKRKLGLVSSGGYQIKKNDIHFVQQN